MEQLILSLQNLLVAGWGVVVSLLFLIAPWSPLIAWVGFWLLAVNWGKLYPVLARGGAVGVLLVGLMMILIWGLMAPPPDGFHDLFGLKVMNFVGKTIYVTMLLTIMTLCGAVQLSGACDSWACFPEDSSDVDHDSGITHESHESDAHAGHGH